jgi:hypothetical protein
MTDPLTAPGCANRLTWNRHSRRRQRAPTPEASLLGVPTFKLKLDNTGNKDSAEMVCIFRGK